MSQTPAGWYPQADGRQRYWDGQQWTEHFAPAQGTVPAPAPAAAPKRAWYAKKRVIIPGALLALAIVGSAMGGGGDDPTTNVADTTSASAAPAPAKAAAATKSSASKTAAKPSAKAAPKPAPKPAAKGIGDTVRDGKFAFTVRSVKCGIAKVGTNPYLTKKAQGQFCAVALTVNNIGDQSQMMFADNQYAFDAKSRKFSADSEASMYDDSSQVLWEEINPGNAVKGTVYFDVPKGVKITKLELHDSMFSGGVSVAAK